MILDRLPRPIRRALFAGGTRQDRLHDPDAVLRVLDLRPGMVVGGPGPRRRALHPPPRPRSRAGRRGLRARREPDDARRPDAGLPTTVRSPPLRAVRVERDRLEVPGPVELLFVSATYHHLPDPPTYFAEARAHLRPGARVAILESRREGLLAPWRGRHASSPRQLLREMTDAGYRLCATHDLVRGYWFGEFEVAAVLERHGHPVVWPSVRRPQAEGAPSVGRAAYDGDAEIVEVDAQMSSRITSAAIADLGDDVLVAFVSDTHMGGDAGADLFEAHEELAALFRELGTYPGPVELVLAGDIFDLLRIGEVPAGDNRVSFVLAQPAYAALIEAWRTFAAGDARRVTYLPGNHDVEVWWNDEVRGTLQQAGLVHEFALAYAARYRSIPDRLIFCEHGNQLDRSNARANYDDPLESPLGDHVVADVMRPIAPRAHLAARNSAARRPERLPADPGSRMAHRAPVLRPARKSRLLRAAADARPVRGAPRPGMAASHDPGHGLGRIGHRELLRRARRGRRRPAPGLRADLQHRASGTATVHGVHRAASGGRERGSSLARANRGAEGFGGQPVPNVRDVAYRDIDVFVWGHSHAPSLTVLEREADTAIAANTGCWLRQLQPVRAHLRAPPIFVSRFVLTHVRVRRVDGGLQTELWEHARQAPQRLLWPERLAILGRLRTRGTPEGPRLVRSAALFPGGVTRSSGRTR